MDRQNDLMARQAYEQLVASLTALPPEQAIASIEQFLHDQPDYAQAHNDLGVLQYQLGNKLQALGRYERAVKLAPRNLTFRKNLASFYYVELGWTDDAIQLYTGLLQDDPTDIEILSALALISSEAGQQDEARIFLQRIVALQPDNQEAASMLAALQEPAMPAAAELPPRAPVTDDSQAEMDSLLAELQQSIAGLTTAAPAPTVPPSSGQPQPEDAGVDPRLADLESRLRNDPTNALLHNDLGVLYLEKGDRALSLSHHEMACRYAPDNLTFLKNLAGVCACSPDTLDRAIELLSTTLVKHPTDTDLLAALGHLSLQCGRPDEALIFLRRILDFEPWNQEARAIVMQLQNNDVKGFFLTP